MESSDSDLSRYDDDQSKTDETEGKSTPEATTDARNKQAEAEAAAEEEQRVFRKIVETLTRHGRERPEQRIRLIYCLLTNFRGEQCPSLT